MDPTAVAGFAVIAFALIAVPGPDWAFVLAAGARDHVVWPAVGGLMVGYLVLTAVVAVGIGPLIAAIPLAMTLLTVPGDGIVRLSIVLAADPRAKVFGSRAAGARLARE